MKLKKILRPLSIILMVVLSVLFCLSALGTAAHAAGLVDDTLNSGNLYSRYPITNYQLDFYVDNSWAWLPWNWGDGIGKSVMYGLYCITNFIWIISMYLSNATGYVVQQAYTLDFINDTADEIGKNIQTLAGVTAQGFSREGFYVGFLLILILVLGIYVAYTGLLKRETSKAIHAVTNFVVVFLLSAAFIAYAPSYIKNINDFSSDISTAALTLGTKLVVSDSANAGKNSVDMIRNNLFSIQIEQPWLLLQYGTTSKGSIGADRVEHLLSTSPKANDGKDREEVVKSEIENWKNTNLSLAEVVNRLGMVFFLLIFNLGITIFVFLLTGIMIFSQILFIIFAMFLPISFLLSMIPTYEGMAKKAIVKVFNTIMMRAGITLVITIAFSISTMFYSISEGYPFFMIAFLQIVTFAGIYFQLGELMGMFSLQAGDSQNMGRKLLRKPYMFMRQNARRLERRIGRSFTSGHKGSKSGRTTTASGAANSTSSNIGKAAKATPAAQNKQAARPISSPGGSAGAAIGTVLDTKNRVKDKAVRVKENIENLPTQAAFALHTAKEAARENISDFKNGIVSEQEERQAQRNHARQERSKDIAQKQQILKQAANQKQNTSANKTSSSPYAPAYVTMDKKVAAQPTRKERPAATISPSGDTEKTVPPTLTPAKEERPTVLSKDASRDSSNGASRDSSNGASKDTNKNPNSNTNQSASLRESAAQRPHAASEKEKSISRQAPPGKTYTATTPVPKERITVSAKHNTRPDSDTSYPEQPKQVSIHRVVHQKTNKTATVNTDRIRQIKQMKSVSAKKGQRK